MAIIGALDMKVATRRDGIDVAEMRRSKLAERPYWFRLGRARARRTIVPGSRPLTRCPESSPSGIARTVIEIVLRSRFGGELTE